MNITRSGRTCQSWKSQCPHRHWSIPKDVADSQMDSNLCRNPDSSAPDGPWCYTTDPNVRWEYCNVSRCRPRGKFNRPTHTSDKEDERAFPNINLSVKALTLVICRFDVIIPATKSDKQLPNASHLNSFLKIMFMFVMFLIV